MAPAENNAECLLARARRAASRAHCPYSNFHVGPQCGVMTAV